MYPVIRKGAVLSESANIESFSKYSKEYCIAGLTGLYNQLKGV